jgi:hypothetical protein
MLEREMIETEREIDQQIEAMRQELSAMDEAQFSSFYRYNLRIIELDYKGVLANATLRARLANLALDIIMLADERASYLEEA